MAINTLEFAEKLTGELDRMIVQKAVTGFMADNVMQARFVGARTVLIPDVDMAGLGDYDRDAGFVQGAVKVSNTSYTMTMDRGRSFQIDREDNDETGVAGLAGQVMGEFIRTRVAPEMDAYILSKLAKLASDKTHTVTATLPNEAVELLTDGITKVQACVGYDEPLVAFVNSAVYGALLTTTELNRQLEISSFRKGEVDTQVRSINGVAVLPVPDNRMKSAYTFYDGAAEGQEDGGFAPATGAKNVGLLVLPKKAASLVKKSERIRTFAPEQNQAADAFRLDYRIYYDVFVKKSMADAVYAYLY